MPDNSLRKQANRIFYKDQFVIVGENFPPN